MAKLISFDIDGTLEVGDPPGSITMALVRQALELGYIIGQTSSELRLHIFAVGLAESYAEGP